MRAFLDSGEPLAVVLEDDAILEPDRSWMRLQGFDLFIPFAHNRVHRSRSRTIRPGVLPRFGSFAYLCSRAFAARYLPRLLKGEVADHASHRAAAGLVTGSFAGNLVNHDNEAHSLISESRRMTLHARQNGGFDGGRVRLSAARPSARVETTAAT